MAEAGDGIDELYGLDPNDFVAARNDLVKRLKKELEEPTRVVGIDDWAAHGGRKVVMGRPSTARMNCGVTRLMF